MKIIRSLNIKRETRQVFTFKTRAETIYALCSHCGIEKRMISAVISARILNISERKIFALVENETLDNFKYLEHGAFYALGCLAFLMLFDILYSLTNPEQKSEILAYL